MTVRCLNAANICCGLLVSVALVVSARERAWADDEPGAALSRPMHAATPFASSHGSANSAGSFGGNAVASKAAGRQSGSSVADGNVVRGVVRAYETATIAAELNARIVSLPFRDGDRFKQGDVLVQFDCERLDAEAQAAAAAHRAHAIAHANQVRLQRYKAAGNAAVQQSHQEAAKAAADLKALLARQKACTIAAPFAGRVTERTANAHEIAQPNQPLLKIVNDRRLELVLMVPSRWVAGLQTGGGFLVRIDETGEQYPARITQIGGAIEPISQSVRIVGEITAVAPSVLLGMSGSAILVPGNHGR
jgi:membrane fusion protein, multidrug efflux system